MSDYKTKHQNDPVSSEKVYKMSHICEQLNMTPRTIRYYESEGLLPSIKRSIGYTRYFTDADIQQLKHVLKLKKKGLKLKAIKHEIQKKTPQKTAAQFGFLCVQDTLVTQTEAEALLANGASIQYSKIVWDGLSIDYTNWETLLDTQWSAPFKIETQRPKASCKLALQTKINKKAWMGNAQRSLVHYILNCAKDPSAECTPQSLTERLNNAIEWFVLPIDIHAPDILAQGYSNMYLFESRSAFGSHRYILDQAGVSAQLSKEIKSRIWPMHGTHHVTLSMHPKAPHAHWVQSLVDSLVPNKDRLATEPLGPMYALANGTQHAALMSIV
jgi:DNA-binding transcriptional MerR regulator